MSTVFDICYSSHEGGAVTVVLVGLVVTETEEVVIVLWLGGCISSFTI